MIPASINNKTWMNRWYEQNKHQWSFVLANIKLNWKKDENIFINHEIDEIIVIFCDPNFLYRIENSEINIYILKYACDPYSIFYPGFKGMANRTKNDKTFSKYKIIQKKSLDKYIEYLCKDLNQRSMTIQKVILYH